MASIVMTLDTSGLVALTNDTDREHGACRAIFEADDGPYFIPAAVLAEIAWLLESRRRTHIEDALLEDIADGIFLVDWHNSDVSRIITLTHRYRDLDLGLADAAVIACAERHGGRVLTTDRRHFPVVARGERTLTVLPQ